MTTNTSNRAADIFTRYEQPILEDWLREQLAALTARQDLISEADLRRQSTELFALFISACRTGSFTDISTPGWKTVLEYLANVSRTRAQQGFTPSETATVVFSIKQPLFARLRQELGANAEALADELWSATVLLDKLGLYTTEVFLKSREDIIKRQQAEMLELSTPVVKLWDGVLAVPLVGTLDSARTQVVMEGILQSIVDTGSSMAIVDITGVPIVDTLVAQHLLNTVFAAKLMGAQCIISGIRPQIAQAMVHLGVEFGSVVTKATLADALAYAFQQIGVTVTNKAPIA
ncbi:MAG: STAS domain-containing protein [Methylococcaceae bacterium]